MFSSPFLILQARSQARRGPSGFSRTCLRHCCFSSSRLSLIPAAHSVLKTVSRSQPSKQDLPSYCWLSAVSCQLPNPAALVRQTPHVPVRSACLSAAPPIARRSTKAEPLSPLAATFTKNRGRVRKRVRRDVARHAYLSLRAGIHLFPVFSETSEQLRAQRGVVVSWRNPNPGEKNAGAERHRELDYVEWNPAFCIAVRASGFFMNVSQTRPLR